MIRGFLALIAVAIVAVTAFVLGGGHWPGRQRPVAGLAHPRR